MVQYCEATDSDESDADDYDLGLYRSALIIASCMRRNRAKKTG